jgi:hypothetical protein
MLGPWPNEHCGNLLFGQEAMAKISWYFAFWMRPCQSPQVFGGVNGITQITPTYFWDYF